MTSFFPLLRGASFSVTARVVYSSPVAVSLFFNPSQTLKASYIVLKTRDCHAIRKHEARNDPYPSPLNVFIDYKGATPPYNP